jgi:drug/metabolite transporter (DMT)-like permease
MKLMWLQYALLASILWGLNYTLNAKLLQFISPLSLMAVQMGLGSILFFSMSNFAKINHEIKILLNHKQLILIILSTVLIMMLANFCIYKSISSKNAVLAAIIETCYPMFTLLFSWLIYRENFFNLHTIFGGLFILIGIVIISRT